MDNVNHQRCLCRISAGIASGGGEEYMAVTLCSKFRCNTRYNSSCADWVPREGG